MSSDFAYGAFTLSGWLSQTVLLSFVESIMQSEPRMHALRFGLFRVSLAATYGIDVSFSSSGYLDVSVHRVPSIYYVFITVTWSLSHVGFPHSDIYGSMDICSSP